MIRFKVIDTYVGFECVTEYTDLGYDDDFSLGKEYGSIDDIISRLNNSSFSAWDKQGKSFWHVDVSNYLKKQKKNDNSYVGRFLKSKEFQSFLRERKLKRILNGIQ